MKKEKNFIKFKVETKLKIQDLKSRHDKNRQTNNLIKSKQISFKVNHVWDYEIIVFILKCVSITNISIKHYMEGVIR